MNPRARFPLVFALVLSVELGLIVWGFEHQLDPVANRATARLAAGALSLLEGSCHAAGDVVTCVSLSTVRIIFECTGVFPVAIFLAGVIAFPASWRWRVVGAGLGIPAILAVNLVRVMSLVWIEGRYPQATEWVHLVLWQTLMVVAVVLLWLAWARSALRARPGFGG